MLGRLEASDLKSGKLTTPIEKFLDKKEPGYPEWMVEGFGGTLWSSCHYMMFEDCPYPYSQTLKDWEMQPQMGIEPVTY